MQIFSRFFILFYCEMYVVLREKKKKLFYKNKASLHVFKLY